MGGQRAWRRHVPPALLLLALAALLVATARPTAVVTLPLIEQTRIPVIIATRTHAGPVLPLYGYAGGGATLLRAGAIPASFLNAHKARLLLIVLLGMGLGRGEIAGVFERGEF